MKTNITATDVAFTAMCLIEDFTHQSPSKTPWEQVCQDYREGNGIATLREELATFAYNIEEAYTLASSQYDGEIMEILSEKADLHTYDLDLVPYIAGKAAEKGKVTLSTTEILAELNAMTELKPSESGNAMKMT